MRYASTFFADVDAWGNLIGTIFQTLYHALFFQTLARLSDLAVKYLMFYNSPFSFCRGITLQTVRSRDVNDLNKSCDHKRWIWKCFQYQNETFRLTLLS